MILFTAAKFAIMDNANSRIASQLKTNLKSKYFSQKYLKKPILKSYRDLFVFTKHATTFFVVSVCVNICTNFDFMRKLFNN